MSEMKIYLYKGEGMYGMGSAVAAVSPSDAEAYWTIKLQLRDMGLPEESKIKHIRENTASFPVSTATVIYTDNGDY
jgi:hypothetical protein